MNLPDLILPKRKHFGLSLGRTSLRAVQIEHGKVKSASEVLLAEGIFNDGVLINKDLFVSALKQLLEAGKFSTPYITVCFSEAHAYSREYTLPLVSVDEIKEAVSWHVKDLFPFPEDEIYFDWRLITSTEKEHKVIVVAVPKNVLDPLIEALSAAGLKPLSFQPGTSAIARLLELKDEQLALVTEVNKKGAYVTLVGGEKSLFTAVVNYTVEDTPETYLKAILQTTDEMIAYYKARGVISDSNFVGIVLSGELASESLITAIQSNAKYPVKILSTPMQNASFNKAYAIATLPIAPPGDIQTINLLPTDLQQVFDTERNNLFYKTVLIRMCIVLSLLVTISLGIYVSASVKKQSLDQRNKELTAKSKGQKGETQSLLLLNAQAKNIVNLAPLRKTPRDKLSVLSKIIPMAIHITQWEYDDSRLIFTLIGVADTREELLAFKQKLEATQEFEKIILPLGSFETPINIRFSITFISK